MWIKICGLSTQAAVETAVKAGATHIGFVFADSKRKVTPEYAKYLGKFVPKTVKKVGLFVNEDLTLVQDIVAKVGLDMVQLHGQESADYAAQVGVPVIKAFGIKDGKLPDNISEFKNQVILLDAPPAQFAGGSGTSFDWQALDLSALDGYQFFVAGGLTPENVDEAIRYFPTAYGVDISSGVETNGVKDLEKINHFIEKASVAHSEDLLAECLAIIRKLNDYHIVPYLMGSLAVTLVAGFPTNPDDIELQLRQADFQNFDLLTEVMASMGYQLIDLQEHKFSKGKIRVGFANVETLKKYADVDYSELALGKNQADSSALFYLPNIAQQIKIYKAATQDSWRAGKPKDQLILNQLKEQK